MKKLSVKKVAELKGCTERNIRKLISEGKMTAHPVPNCANGQMQYVIYLEELPMELQEVYARRYGRGKVLQLSLKSDAAADETLTQDELDSFTDSQRREIACWKNICACWLVFASSSDLSKADAMDKYIEKVKEQKAELLDELGITVSKSSLYRKLQAYRANDIAGLANKRGYSNRGKSKIHPQVWDLFLYHYLDNQNLPSFAQVYDDIKEIIDEYPDEIPCTVEDLPHIKTFIRHYETDVPEALKILGRLGPKAYSDKCEMYIERSLEGMVSNDVWVADNYTLDVIAIDEDGTQRRLSLTAFVDIRSGIVTGMYVTDNPCGASTLMALADGIARYGIPRVVYFDNGKEFLCRDIGGKGNRAKKSVDYSQDPPTILQQLGIEMRVAIVRNAKAKPIERTFKVVKERVMRLFETYTGGNIMERPENLKSKLKRGEIPTAARIREEVKLLIESEYNYKAYGGKSKIEHGKTRMEVWQDNLTVVRKATQSELALMMMRSQRPVKYGRNGVKITLSGTDMYYSNDEHRLTLFGKKVYVRYDATKVETVRLYEAETDKYICDAMLNLDLFQKYGAENEDLSLAQERIRRISKADKQRLKELQKLGGLDIDVLDMKVRKGRGYMRKSNIPDNTPVELIRFKEKQYYEPEQQAVGGSVVIDINKMVTTAERQK